jgi:hypothetical protein
MPDPTMKPRGSMMSNDTLQTAIESSKRMSSGTPKEDEAEQPAAVEELSEPAKAAMAALPAEVACLLGKLPYADFRAAYQAIYKQVQDKEHLIRGKVSWTAHLSDTEVTLQSLKMRERRALIPLAGDPRDENIATYSDNDMDYKLHLLAISLVRLGEASFDLPDVPAGGVLEWKQLPAVQNSVAYLEDMDESMIDILMQMFTDMTNAKQFALLENLKNQ